MKKATKRKMYHKRRKKEKADARRNNKTQPETMQRKIPPKPATIYKYNNCKQFQRNQFEDFRTCNNNHRHEFMNPSNLYTQRLQLWWHTYCNAIQYHAQQQKRWNSENSQLQIPNNDGHNLTLLEKYSREYETSSEEEDEDEQQNGEYYFLSYPSDIDGSIDSKTDDVDEDYLKFLEITHKHKEELRLKKAEENL